MTPFYSIAIDLPNQEDHYRSQLLLVSLRFRVSLEAYQHLWFPNICLIHFASFSIVPEEWKAMREKKNKEKRTAIYTLLRNGSTKRTALEIKSISCFILLNFSRF